jgi:hypothetical protein
MFSDEVADGHTTASRAVSSDEVVDGDDHAHEHVDVHENDHGHDYVHDHGDDHVDVHTPRRQFARNVTTKQAGIATPFWTYGA